MRDLDGLVLDPLPVGEDALIDLSYVALTTVVEALTPLLQPSLEEDPHVICQCATDPQSFECQKAVFQTCFNTITLPPEFCESAPPSPFSYF